MVLRPRFVDKRLRWCRQRRVALLNLQQLEKTGAFRAVLSRIQHSSRGQSGPQRLPLSGETHRVRFLLKHGYPAAAVWKGGWYKRQGQVSLKSIDVCITVLIWEVDCRPEAGWRCLLIEHCWPAALCHFNHCICQLSCRGVRFRRRRPGLHLTPAVEEVPGTLITLVVAGLIGKGEERAIITAQAHRPSRLSYLWQEPVERHQGRWGLGRH